MSSLLVVRHSPDVPRFACPAPALAEDVSLDEPPGEGFQYDAATLSFLPTDDRQLFSKLSTILRDPMRRICAWRVPPNWSRSDWVDEMGALAATAVWQAACEYDSSRGLPLSAFIYLRVVAIARTRYRQEWGYALHCLCEADRAERECASVTGNSSYPPTMHELLQFALAQLSESDQRLIEHLFWYGETEAEVAQRLEISHQAVSKRKRKILRDLRAGLSVEI